MRRHASAVVCIALGLSSVVAACGSRGPLDIQVVEAVSSTDSGSNADVALDGTNEGAADARDDAREAGRDATVVDCVVCLGQQCGPSVVQCLQSQACQTTFQCAVQKCFTTGNPNPSCLAQCANDPQGAAQALRVIQCVTNKCGKDCTSLIGVLGGGGGGGRDAGRRASPEDELHPLPETEEERLAVLRESFSAWPGLCE